MPRPPAFPARGHFGPVRAASPVQSRGEGPGQHTRAPHHPGSPQLRHCTSGLSRTRRQDEAPGTKERPSNKLLVEGSFPPGPPRSRRLGPGQRFPRSPRSTGSAVPETRAPGGMLGCSLRPYPGPLGPGPREGCLRPWPAGRPDKGKQWAGKGRSQGAGGKGPETRSAGSEAPANSGKDASALSLLCISSTRKANSSAEGLNQAFI